MALIEPFATQLDLQTGKLSPVTRIVQRRLSDMRGMYADTQAENQIIAQEGDRLIYEVYTATELPEEEGQVLHCTTIIYPGKVGDELHMTKGHYHAKRDRGEVYVGLSGEGCVLLHLEDGTVRSVPMGPGTAAYVPPYWAHRTVNTGSAPFSFFSAWPGDAGHDYATIERVGFAKIMVWRDGKAVLVDNPRYK